MIAAISGGVWQRKKGVNEQTKIKTALMKQGCLPVGNVGTPTQPVERPLGRQGVAPVQRVAPRNLKVDNQTSLPHSRSARKRSEISGVFFRGEIRMK